MTRKTRVKRQEMGESESPKTQRGKDDTAAKMSEKVNKVPGRVKGTHRPMNTNWT